MEFTLSSALRARRVRSGADGYQVTSPAPIQAWQQVLSANDSALVTQTPQWMASIVAGGRWRDRSRLYDLDDGRRLLVPMVGMGRGPAGIARSWPYGWGYGGALSSTGAVTGGDVSLIAHDLARIPGVRTSLVTSPWEPQWQNGPFQPTARVNYLTHILDLAGGDAGVWKGYAENVRRSVRRAEKSGLEVVRDDTGAMLPAYRDLHRKSVIRWAQSAGQPVTPARIRLKLSEVNDRLPTLSRELGQAMVLWVALVRGEPAAAIVVLAGSAHALYWRGAMDRELAGPTHANALLHHLAIREAVSAGARSYCFGESGLGSALATYKSKFGAKPVEWSTYHWERVPVTAATAAVLAGYRRVAPLVAKRISKAAQ